MVVPPLKALRLDEMTMRSQGVADPQAIEFHQRLNGALELGDATPLTPKRVTGRWTDYLYRKQDCFTRIARH